MNVAHSSNIGRGGSGGNGSKSAKKRPKDAAELLDYMVCELLKVMFA